jgi:multidrug efflux system membrane fusion protein
MRRGDGRYQRGLRDARRPGLKGVNKRRTLAVLAVVVVAGAAAATWKWNLQSIWSPQGAVAQAPAQPRLVAVEIATAVKKSTPVRIEALGTVMPMASVAIKSRIDSEITGVHFADGARVKQGDLLITLDSRSIEAQILQAEGNIARDRAQLEGAERDLRRYTELVAKGATAITNLDNAKTQAAVYTAALKANDAILKHLHIQLSYATIRAPISGRISAASVKVGNIVRAADLLSIATIIQTAPIYVSFPMTQSQLPALRDSIAEGAPSVEAVIPGDTKRALGRIAMIENTVDAGTGMVNVRATMPNENEALWPGTLVQTFLNLRNEEAVTVPSAAVQVSQTGSYVYVIKNDVAELHPVKIARTLGSETVLESGVADGDAVVVNGHLQLTNGARVAVRAPKKADG